MRARLPTCKIVLVEEDGKKVAKYELDEIEVDICTNVYAEENFEKHFPNLACKETLFDYITRINEAQSGALTYLLCLLKVTYCCIKDERFPTFKDFAYLFDMSNKEYFQKLISELDSVYKYIQNASATKN